MRVYYCNGCHKLYCITDNQEHIINFNKPSKVYPRPCLTCQIDWSQFLTKVCVEERTKIEEAMRIIKKNSDDNGQK